MLNETARSLTSERVVDLRATGASTGPLSLNCASCGGQVELPFWEPQARCPHCNTLGYPDRALRNLLPLGWDCPTCGAANDGRTNFCLSCGAGLASRCQRCEAPVYGSICLQCGEHQARPRQLQKSQSERIEWLPVQRERIEKQVAHLRRLEAAEAVAAEPVLPARSPHPQTKAERKAERKAAKRARRGGRGFDWRWMLLAAGAFMIMRDFRNGAFSQFMVQDAAPTLSTTWASIQGLLSGVAPAMGRITTLSPEQPEYAYLFAVVLGGLVALPFGLYLIDRVIKRFFP
jgi:Double zinc ribbon